MNALVAEEFHASVLLISLLQDEQELLFIYLFIYIKKKKKGEEEEAMQVTLFHFISTSFWHHWFFCHEPLSRCFLSSFSDFSVVFYSGSQFPVAGLTHGP